MLILNLIIVSWNSVPKIPFSGKYNPETQECFVLPKKVFWGQHLRKQLSNSELSTLNNYMSRVSFKTMPFEVRDQICPKKINTFNSNLKIFWRQNLRKQLSSSESVPLNMHQVSFKTKHFEVLGRKLIKEGVLGTKFKKIKRHTTVFWINI